MKLQRKFIVTVGIVAYDGSHSLRFNPQEDNIKTLLGKARNLLFGSTHKTFPGPQGGLIVTNDEHIHRRIDEYANFTPLNGPTLICNPHLGRIASMGIVLEETPWKKYAKQVVTNTRTIAQTLFDEGIPLHGVETSKFSELTYCHQVVTDFSKQSRCSIKKRITKLPHTC